MVYGTYNELVTGANLNQQTSLWGTTNSITRLAYDWQPPHAQKAPKSPRNVWRNARPTRASSAASGAPQRRRFPRCLTKTKRRLGFFLRATPSHRIEKLEIPWKSDGNPENFETFMDFKTVFWWKDWFEWDSNGEHISEDGDISTYRKWWFSQTVIPKQIELDQIRS